MTTMRETITLIPQTAQEAFDSVWHQLKAQTHRAYTKVEDMASGSCRYRVPNGTPGNDRCAIGGMIPDDQYDESIEGKRASALISNSRTRLTAHPLIVTDIPSQLLDELQRVHDDGSNWVVYPLSGQEFGLNSKGWAALRYLATLYGLVVPE